MRPETERLLDIPPDQIRRNPENPRIHFTEQEMDELASSIDEVGVLVPVSVYYDPEPDQPSYVLIDGERRWRCAAKLGLESLPAIILTRPSPTDNLLTMFNIHMLREQWRDMPMAWALGKVMERTGKSDPKDLAQLTGLHPRRVERLLLALELPERYQGYIDSEKIPLNFFFELDRDVLRPLAEQRPGILRSFGTEPGQAEDAIREAFVEKKLAGITNDTVELRRIRPIISVAAEQAGGPEKSSQLDAAIIDLIRTRDRTIQETYENTVEMIVEASKFARQCQAIITRLDLLLESARDPDERQAVFSSVRNLIAQLQVCLRGNPESDESIENEL